MGIRNAFNRMIEARERHARAYVAEALSHMDDDTLRRAGIERSQIGRRSPNGYPY